LKNAQQVSIRGKEISKMNVIIKPSWWNTPYNVPLVVILFLSPFSLQLSVCFFSLDLFGLGPLFFSL
jgi:hypothetical protein